jgi:hypothetical protein
MNRITIVIVAVCVLAGLAFLAKNINQPKVQAPAEGAAPAADLEQAAPSWLAETQQAVQEASQATQQAAQEAQEAVEQIAAEAGNVQAQIQEWLTQANANLEQGNYQAAIDAANFILNNLDGNSAEAQSIVEAAQAKLTGQTAQQAPEVKEGFSGSAENAVERAAGAINQ